MSCVSWALKYSRRAIRYAGSTFAYTAIAVLLNYSTYQDFLIGENGTEPRTMVVSPPHLVAFSNGLG